MFEDGVEAAFADLGVSTPSLLGPRELVQSLQTISHAKGFAAWAEYSTAAQIHQQLAEPGEKDDLRQLDGWAQCSARIAACLNLTSVSADGVLRRGLALRDRLPLVNDALKAGQIAPHHIPDIVSRTDLIEGMPWAAAIDAEIAEMLWRDGSWSVGRMRNMVDQIVFRHDPEGVRERREKAKTGRNFQRYPTVDGMADIVASMTAENALLLDKRVQDLADRVCKCDPRTKPQRLSDALFCATMGVDFACECGDNECEYAFRDPDDDEDGSAQFIVHVVMDQATAEGRASNPGFIDGHGVVSGDHASDIARRHDARIRPLGGEFAPGRAPKDVADENASKAGAPTPRAPEPAPQMSTTERLSEWKRLTDFSPKHTTREAKAKEGPIVAGCQAPSPDPDPASAPAPMPMPMPMAMPSNPYRLSTALNTFVRIRDAYCVFPGCSRAAWRSEVDHTEEYDHEHPEAGGQTCPEDTKCLCKFHHLLKSFGDWIDVQELDEQGRSRIVFISPEGQRFEGPAWTGEDLFPALTAMRWTGTRLRSIIADTRNRRRTRLVAKHARRQAERDRNRRRRDLPEPEPDPIEVATRWDGQPPPF